MKNVTGRDPAVDLLLKKKLGGKQLPTAVKNLILSREPLLILAIVGTQSMLKVLTKI
jgi:hypothetical protein